MNLRWKRGAKTHPVTKESPLTERRARSEGHRVVYRTFSRTDHQIWCDEPACRFFGLEASQGHCYSRKSHLGGKHNFAYIDKASARAKEELDFVRKQCLGKGGRTDTRKLIKYLESSFVCAHLNNEFGLDMLIHLRMRVAELEVRLKVYGASKCAKRPASGEETP